MRSAPRRSASGAPASPPKNCSRAARLGRSRFSPSPGSSARFWASREHCLGGRRFPRPVMSSRVPNGTSVTLRDPSHASHPAPSVACALLGRLAMTAGTAGAPGHPRAWDTPERTATFERIYRELMAVDQLPSAPEVAQKLLVMVSRDDVSAPDLSKLIGCDQALTARLLRLANSAFFAIRSKVAEIPQAGALLGFGRGSGPLLRPPV